MGPAALAGGDVQVLHRPQLEAKVRDVVGLYLHPPEKAVVLCVDEKSQVQALDRTAPILPMRPGLPEKATHDYVRHGTTTLFAALEVATGKVVDACFARHRHQEFLRFLNQVAKAYPRVKLHLVCDNYATHKHPAVQGVAGAQPADHAALHPDLGVVAEHGRGLLRDHHPPGHPPRQLPPASTTSSTAIRAFIDGWNNRCRPFVWTKTADELLDHTPQVNEHRSRDTRRLVARRRQPDGGSAGPPVSRVSPRQWPQARSSILERRAAIPEEGRCSFGRPGRSAIRRF